MTLKRSFILFTGILMALSLLPVAVMAQDNGNESDETLQTTESDTGASDRLRNLRDNLTDRLADYKQNREEALSEAREAIITRKCAAAQTRVEAFKTRVENAKDRRETVYSNITGKLNSIVNRLSETGVDVTELQSLMTTVGSTYDQLLTDFNNFLTVLGDIVDMDCASDPEAFQAALEAARSQAAGLKADVENFHTFLKEDVKTAFRAAVAGLTSDDGGEEN